MNMKITGKTKVLGIIGHPVEHSLSPLMQNAALAALGLDYIYVPFPVEPRNLALAVQGLFSLGIRGFNVTLPHKAAIIPLLDRIAPEADLSGAVNTVCREEGRFVGYNTDGAGLLKSLGDDLSFSPAGASVLILGAGGAARGAVAALCRAGVARIFVANRTKENGAALVDTFRGKFADVQFFLASLEREELAECLKGADLLVNTTSVGMNGSSLPGLDLQLLSSGAKVYDMVYSPPETPLLVAARLHNLSCANGLGMLAAQGEAAFSLWTGMESPRGLMKRKLLEVLFL
jgi:shikimate dehydrogenase